MKDKRKHEESTEVTLEEVDFFNSAPTFNVVTPGEFVFFNPDLFLNLEEETPSTKKQKLKTNKPKRNGNFKFFSSNNNFSPLDKVISERDVKNVVQILNATPLEQLDDKFDSLLKKSIILTYKMFCKVKSKAWQKKEDEIKMKVEYSFALLHSIWKGSTGNAASYFKNYAALYDSQSKIHSDDVKPKNYLDVKNHLESILIQSTTIGLIPKRVEFMVKLLLELVNNRSLELENQYGMISTLK